MIFDPDIPRYGWIDYFHLIRSRWPIVLLICSFVLLAGAEIQQRLPRLYESTLRIEFDAGPEKNQPARSATAFAPTELNDLSRQAAELKSRSLLSEVINACDLENRWRVDGESGALRLLEKRMRISQLPSHRELELSVRDLSPESSAALANAIAARFLERKASEVLAEGSGRVVRLEREVRERHSSIAKIEDRLVEIGARPERSASESADLRQQLVSERSLLRSLEAKCQLARIEASEAIAPAYVLNWSEVSEARVVSFVWIVFPVLMLVGLGLGGLVVMLMARGETRWNIISSLLERLQLPIAGFAPLSGPSLLSGRLAPPHLIESYRDLRTKLKQLPVKDCLLMTLMPLRDRDGLAEAATNLACVLADGGGTVLVIDADFRNPGLHHFFAAANHPGLSDFLSGEIRLEETVIKTRRPNLWFMPSGPLHDDPAGLINGRRMGDLIWDMRSRFEYILIVSAGIHQVSDAGALAALSDFTAVVTPYRGCSLSQIRKAQIAIKSASGRLAAVFLTTSVQNVGSGVGSGLPQAERFDPLASTASRKASK